MAVLHCVRVQLYFGQFFDGRLFDGRKKLMEVCTLVTGFFLPSKLVKQRGERPAKCRDNRIRTHDLKIKNGMCYRLSYDG